MFDATEIPVTMQPVEPRQAVSLRTSLLYCAAFVAVQLLLLTSSVWIASRPWFLNHNNNPKMIQQVGYSLRARGVNCEIVIYGDSTAEVNLDPSLIQRRTGLKTCNVSEFLPVHRTVGSFFPLDQYLAHNTAPRFLLTMWNPTAYHPSSTQMQGYYPEGVVFALQHDPGLYLVKAFYKHPSYLTNFTTYVIRSIIDDTDSRLCAVTDRQFCAFVHASIRRKSTISSIPRDIQAGLWQIDSPPQTTCEPNDPDPLSQAEKEANLSAFKRRYNTTTTTVLLDIGPLADCYKGIAQIARSNAGLHDNELEFLPYNEFNMASIHVTAAGRQHVTEEAADQILRLMSATGSQPHQRNLDVERHKANDF